MDQRKQRRLKKQGWRVGTAETFLGLTPEDAAKLQAREARFGVIDEIRARNADADPEQVERDVAEAVRAAQQSKSDPK